MIYRLLYCFVVVLNQRTYSHIRKIDVGAARPRGSESIA